MSRGPDARPVPGRHLDRILGTAQRVVDERRGAVVVVTGATGSGKSALLKMANEALGHVDPLIVLGGGVTLDQDGTSEYIPWQVPEAAARARTLALLRKLTAIGATRLPVFGLLMQLLEAAAAARDAFTEMLPEAPRPTEILPRLLREVASRKPLAMVIDDADLGLGLVWRQLIFSLGSQIAQDLPLLLVVAIRDDDAEPPANGRDSESPGESAAQRSVRQLVSRGLAEREELKPFTDRDLRDWLAPVSNEVVRHLLAATAGRPDALGALWEEWVRNGAVIRAPDDGRWTFSSVDEHFVVAPVEDLVMASVIEAIGDDDPQLVQRYARLLAHGALEGRRFTAEAVACALGQDRDLTIDMLDTLTRPVHRGGTVLEEANEGQAIQIGSRALWTYQFPSALYWQCMGRYGFSPSEREEAAGRMAACLRQAYAPELWRVAQPLIDLCMEAGRPEQAWRYRRLADFGRAPGPIVEEARQCVAAGDPVDAWELERAGEAILDCVTDRLHPVPNAQRIALGREAYELGKAAGSGRVALHGLLEVAEAQLNLGLLEEARDGFEEARHLSKAIADWGCHSRATRELGAAIAMRGDLDAGVALIERALAIARSRGLEHASRACLGELLLQYGNARDGDRARSAADAWFEGFDGVHIPRDITLLTLAAVIFHNTGDPERCGDLYRQMLSLKEQRDELFDAHGCINLARLAAGEDDYYSARSLFEEGVARLSPDELPNAREWIEETAELVRLSGDRQARWLTRRYKARPR